MRSLHYPIALPDDFDMAAIAARVGEKAHLFESLPGLAFKAFLASSRAQGAASNAYAPFYVWDDDQAALSFLQGPLFAGVIDGFGRPAVLDRPVLAFAFGDRRVLPRFATLETIVSTGVERPAQIAHREAALQLDALALPGAFAAAAVLDTAAWSVTRVRLWADAASARGVGPDALRYDVLRVVGPGIAD